MVKAHRDCFNVSVAEKLRWFKDAIWDGELGFQSRMALKDLLEHSMKAWMASLPTGAAS